MGPLRRGHAAAPPGPRVTASYCWAICWMRTSAPPGSRPGRTLRDPRARAGQTDRRRGSRPWTSASGPRAGRSRRFSTPGRARRQRRRSSSRRVLAEGDDQLGDESPAYALGKAVERRAVDRSFSGRRPEDRPRPPAPARRRRCAVGRGRAGHARARPQLLDSDRLAHVVVHAGRQASSRSPGIALAVMAMTGGRRGQRAAVAGGLESVHLGHLHVHEHDVVRRPRRAATLRCRCRPRLLRSPFGARSRSATF